MEHCPACGAAGKGERICRRCKLDLGPLIAVEEKAQMHLYEALAACERRDFSAMRFHARRSFSLRKTKTAVRILSISELLNKRYPQAMACRAFLMAANGVTF